MTGYDQNIFNVQFALNQFSGNQSLLLKILVKFDTQFQPFDTLLKENVQQNNLQVVKQQVHELKGVAGNLGMQSLHFACKEFESKFATQVSELDVNDLVLVFKQTIGVLRNYLAENSEVTSKPEAQKQDNKTSLIKALKRNEFISETKLQTYLQSLALPPEQTTEIQQLIDSLDYTNAIKLLEQQ